MSFEGKVKSTFDRLKRKDHGDPWCYLPLYNESRQLQGWLRPIPKDFRESCPELPALLTRWLTENPIISTGSFTPTVERTERWLDKLVIERADRLLFVVLTVEQRPVGYLGLSNINYDKKICFIDSVLRGEKDAPKGIMSLSVSTVMDWAFEELEIQGVELYVYSDNQHAIQFYEKLNFDRGEQIPLVLVQLPGEQKFEAAPPNFEGKADRFYLHMQLDLGRYRSDHSREV